jgi:hypothetical protein
VVPRAVPCVRAGPGIPGHAWDLPRACPSRRPRRALGADRHPPRRPRPLRARPPHRPRGRAGADGPGALRLRISAVQRDVSIAEVLEACDPIFVGDRVRPYDRFLSPTLREFQPLNRFDLPTGKLSGQIVLARNHRDYLGTNDVVYLDIGDDNGVKLGQYYTVYRKPGEEEGPVGGFNRVLRDDEDFEHRVEGFSDDRYRDSDFSVLRGRERPSKVIRERNGIPRKVVGEVCIIRVEKDSATAVVTRVAQEVNLGDYVELQ